MNITFLCGDSWEKWSPKSEQTGIGGSEEAVINMSRELAKLGHDVTVYNHCDDDAGEYDGVRFVDVLDYDNPETDVLIGWRSTQPWKMASSKKNWKVGYHWLHDVMPEDDVMQCLAMGADKIMVLSKYHRRLFPNILNKEIFLTQNGVNLSQFDQKVERVPGRLFWGSSYDRGLKELLEHWPKIKLAVPEATLHIAYGWKTWESLAKRQGDKYYEHFKNLKKDFEEMMGQDGITHLGRISHDQVAKELLEADVWSYPTWWPEISCITAMKAQIAGALPVVIPTAAVAETVQWGYKTDRGYYTGLKGDVAAPGDAIDQWVNGTIEMLQKGGSDETEDYRNQMMEWARKKFDWATVAKDWAAEFERGLDEL